MIGQIASSVPGRITAIYGYSDVYFGGGIFHEGLDTSWRGEPGNNYAIAPMPLSPLIVTPGVVIGIAPCSLRSAMFGLRDEAVIAFNEAMRRLEAREEQDLDCAILFGAFHVVSEMPHSVSWSASVEMSKPENQGKTPWELGIFAPAGSLFTVCATVPGYAGNFAPHCHYQAAIVPGDIARGFIQKVRESPTDLIRPLNVLINSRDPGGASFVNSVSVFCGSGDVPIPRGLRGMELGTWQSNGRDTCGRRTRS